MQIVHELQKNTQLEDLKKKCQLEIPHIKISVYPFNSGNGFVLTLPDGKPAYDSKKFVMWSSGWNKTHRKLTGLMQWLVASLPASSLSMYVPFFLNPRDAWGSLARIARRVSQLPLRVYFFSHDAMMPWGHDALMPWCHDTMCHVSCAMYHVSCAIWVQMYI